MITGRKRVEEAIVEGMLGLLKTQCRRTALKTRNCMALDVEGEGQGITCVPCKRDILEVCEDKECCYYAGCAARACESIQEDVPDAHSRGRDAES